MYLAVEQRIKKRRNTNLAGLLNAIWRTQVRYSSLLEGDSLLQRPSRNEIAKTAKDIYIHLFQNHGHKKEVKADDKDHTVDMKQNHQ